MPYSKITKRDIEYFKKICSPERVNSGAAISEDYSHDEMSEYGKFGPEVVIEALSTEEVATIMKYAYEREIPVTPRGSGTGLCVGLGAGRADTRARLRWNLGECTNSRLRRRADGDAPQGGRENDQGARPVDGELYYCLGALHGS